MFLRYVREGQEKRPPREEVFRHDNRFQNKDVSHYSFFRYKKRTGLVIAEMCANIMKHSRVSCL